MKIAVIGQSVFGKEVYKELRKDGHTIVGVFTIPDKDGKADPLGEKPACFWCLQAHVGPDSPIYTMEQPSLCVKHRTTYMGGCRP